MKDIDALEAILTGTGQPSVIDMLRKRPLHIATPADAVRVEVAEDYDHLSAVVDARFLRIETTLNATRDEIEHIDWHGV